MSSTHEGKHKHSHHHSHKKHHKHRHKHHKKSKRAHTNEDDERNEDLNDKVLHQALLSIDSEVIDVSSNDDDEEETKKDETTGQLTNDTQSNPNINAEPNLVIVSAKELGFISEDEEIEKPVVFKSTQQKQPCIQINIKGKFPESPEREETKHNQSSSVTSIEQNIIQEKKKSTNEKRRKRNHSDDSIKKRYHHHDSDDSIKKRYHHDDSDDSIKKRYHDSDDSIKKRYHHDSDDSIKKRYHDSDDSIKKRYHHHDSDDSIKKRYHHDHDNSDSKYRSHSRRHQRSHSRERKKRKRSYSRDRYTSHRQYSSSPDYNRKRRRSRSSSCHYKKRSKYHEKKEATPPASKPVIVTSKNEKLEQFTAFCQQLSKMEDDKQEEDTVLSNEVQHPFQLCSAPQLVYHNDAWKTPSQMVLDNNTVMPVEERFPVSSGIKHANEIDSNTITNSQSVSELVVQRAVLQQRLTLNPNDITAILSLNNIERKVAEWSQGQIKPGQFTGQKEVIPIPKHEHDRGVQAWAKKNMFKSLTPVMSGFGMKLMMKMGWEYGKPLGMRGEGYTEPIPLDVKVDRQGLSTQVDKSTPTVPSSIPMTTGKSTPSCIKGKHPVNALQELCSIKQWGVPEYELLSETGPSHMKSFIYRVKIKVGTFQPACCSNTKKMAKVQAAISCLKSLGLMDDDTK